MTTRRRFAFRPRPSARLRLTVLFAILITFVGGSIVASICLAMALIPDYRLLGVAVDVPTDGPTADSKPLESMRPTSPSDDDGLGRVLVTSPHEILRLLLTTSLIVFGAVTVLGVIACWIVAGRVLRPIESITEAARRAASGSLDHRIALSGPDDEFRRLAETFDDMLERLDAAFDAQRRFTANASHELRTPLATTQALLDVALLDPDDFDRATLTTKLRETNTRNIETVEALLALSDAQSGTHPKEHVRIDEIVREVVASNAVDADERGVSLHHRGAPCATTGDPTLVRLLVSNLVSNAVRYNITGGGIWITVGDSRVTVENTGVPISDDALPRLTEPFFRAAGRVTNSHGLGLALVKAIADGHGAELTVAAREGGGLCVTVAFEPAA
jgi:two-component system sensor histidine kinase VanS